MPLRAYLGVLILCTLAVRGPAEAPADQDPKLREAAGWLSKAQALRRAGKKPEARAAAEQAVAAYREVPGDGAGPDLASALRLLGQLNYEAGKLEEADKILREAAECWFQLKREDTRPAILNLIDLGNLQKALGTIERSENYYRRAYLAQQRRTEKDDVSASAARAMGLHYLNKGEYKRAGPPLREALDIRRKVLGKKNLGYARSLNDLGVLFSRTHQYQLAERHLAEAAEVFEAHGPTSVAYASCLGNLGVLFHKTGDLDRAKKMYQESLAIFKKVRGENDPACGKGLLNLGQLAATQGDYGEAGELLGQARRIFDENPDQDTSSRAILFGALAKVHAATGRPAEAFAESVQTLEIQQKDLQRIFAFSSEAAMYSYLATVRGDLDRLLTVAVGYQRTDPKAAATALTWVLRRKGIIVETMSQFRAAEQAVTHDLNVRLRVQNLQQKHKSLADISADPRHDGDPAFERMKAKLAERIDTEERQLHNILSAYRRKQTQPFHTVEAEQVRARLPAGAALVEVVRAAVQDFKAKGKEPNWKPEHYLAFVLTADKEAPVRLLDLGPAEAIDKAVQEFRQKIQEAPRELRVSDEKTVEEDFQPLGQALYRLVFAPLVPALGKTTLIYLAPDGELNRVPFEALVDGDEKYLVETFRFAYLGTGRDLLPRPMSQTAGKPPALPKASPPAGRPGRPGAAPGPAAPPRRPAGGRGTVVFAGPEYDLKADRRQARAREILGDQLASAGALRGATRVEPERVEVRATNEERAEARTTNTRGIRWTALPGAAGEADDVEKALQSPRFRPVKKFVGADALEEVFKAIEPPRILHIATHGFFLPDVKPDTEPEQGAAMAPEARAAPAPEAGAAPGPEVGAGSRLARLKKLPNPLLRSGIVLAGANAAGEATSARADDGWVTAEEIALMDLHGTELVVLSACETGLGDVRTGQGVYGLRHAFLYAGARSLVLSLFEVPDVQTREMMKRFYESLDARTGKLDSLHQAQLEMLRRRRKESGAAHPFFWAGFVLVGDPK